MAAAAPVGASAAAAETRERCKGAPPRPHHPRLRLAGVEPWVWKGTEEAVGSSAEAQAVASSEPPGRLMAAGSPAAARPGSGEGVQLHLSPTSPTGYLGVTRVANGAGLGRYRAQVPRHPGEGQLLYLGDFSTDVKAAEAVARFVDVARRERGRRHLSLPPAPPPNPAGNAARTLLSLVCNEVLSDSADDETPGELATHLRKMRP